MRLWVLKTLFIFGAEEMINTGQTTRCGDFVVAHTSGLLFRSMVSSQVVEMVTQWLRYLEFLYILDNMIFKQYFLNYFNWIYFNLKWFQWKNKIIVFAGYDAEVECYSNETHIFDMETKYWTKAITFGQAARWRDFHTAAEIDDKLYIFGGRADIFGQMQSSNDFYDNKLVMKSKCKLC